MADFVTESELAPVPGRLPPLPVRDTVRGPRRLPVECRRWTCLLLGRLAAAPAGAVSS